jgi:hypothetical protein
MAEMAKYVSADISPFRHSISLAAVLFRPQRLGRIDGGRAAGAYQDDADRVTG